MNYSNISLFTIGVTLTALNVAVAQNRGDVTDEIGSDLGMKWVTNWGEWHEWDYCPKDTWAAGYSMKSEEYVGHDFDDTLLNGIKLYCRSISGQLEREITSGVGPFGKHYSESAYCDPNFFIKSFKIKVEPDQGDDDDTATNSIKFTCTNGKEIEAAGGHHFGDWSNAQVCQDKSFAGMKFKTAICAIKTQIEGKQGGGISGGDDTALNNVRFKCCALPPQ